MDARLNYFGSALGAKLMKHINSANKVVVNSTLPHATQELVKIRASQINGCGFCTDMHTKDATHAGETAQRLNLVAAWREATVFTDAERAALELAEQGSRIADAAAWGHRRGLGERRQALRRGPTGRAGRPHLCHQRLQPHQRHHSAARRELPARPVRLSPPGTSADVPPASSSPPPSTHGPRCVVGSDRDDALNGYRGEAMISRRIQDMAQWTNWVPLISAEPPPSPGVYLARQGADGPVVYVGVGAGARKGGGLRGRLRRYTSGKALASGLGEGIFDRALADRGWLRERLAEVESGRADAGVRVGEGCTGLGGHVRVLGSH